MLSYLITFCFFAFTSAVGLVVWNWILNKKTFTLADIPPSLVVGTALTTWTLFFVAFAIGNLSQFWLYPLLIISTVAEILLLRKSVNVHNNYNSPQPPLSKRGGGMKILILAFYLLVAIFLYGIFSHLLFFENGNLYAGWINVWGDWAAHLSYATSFAYGQNFPPQLPIFTGQVFSYPMLMDFLSSILITLGVDLIPSFILPSFLFTFASFILLGQLTYKLTKKYLAAWFASILFFGGGGLGFVYALFYGVATTELTKIPSENIWWISIITSQFIPQRGFTLGFPIALVVLILLYEISQGKRHFPLFLGAGLLIAILPLIHAHSFMILLFFGGLLYLKTAKSIKHWLIFAVPIVFLATPSLLYFYRGSSVLSSLRFHPGWMAKTTADIPFFWLNNFGLTLPLAIIGFFFLPRVLKNLSLPFWFLFMIANLFIFQPWDWDNTKYLTFWYLGASIMAGVMLTKLITHKKPLLTILATLIFVASIYSGTFDAISLLDVQKNKLAFFSREQVEASDFIRKNTEARAIFLTGDNHDNLVTALAGRRILLGYPGWLWSYGVNYWGRQKDVGLIKTGSDQAQELLTKYKIDYVVIGPQELAQEFNEGFFAKNFPKIFVNGEYTIYKLN